MQFGKISGLSLIILGILLCGFQLVLWVMPQKPVTAPPQSTAAPEHKTPSLPGLIGAASFIAGISLLATARRRDEPDPGHAVK